MTRRSIRRTLSISFLGAAVSASFLLPKTTLASDEEFPSITVRGRAVERVVPDKATFSFSVQSRDKSLAAAVDDNEAKIKSVIEFLQEAGIEPRFIRTDVLRITPMFPPRQSKIKAQLIQQIEQNDDPFEQAVPIGYYVQRGLSITLHDLAAFDKIYRGLIERGVNAVEGLTFETSDLIKYRQQARIKAIRAAREKAQAMAGELGATLASVQSINEAEEPHFRIRSTFNAATVVDGGNSGTGAGEIEISVTVNVVFRLGHTIMEPAGDAKAKNR